MTDHGNDVRRVAVVGRYPPPLDGQSIQTRRLADMLHGGGSRHEILHVRRINTEPPNSAVAEHAPRSMERLRHFIGLRRPMADQLEKFQPDVILWASVSSGIAGHFRDLLLLLPSFPESAGIYAVVHRGNFEDLFRSRLTGRTARWIVDNIDGFVFLSRGLSERCARWIPEDKRFVIPNTVESDLVFEAGELDEKRADFLRRDDLRVLYLSNMIMSKGYLDVAKAVALIEDPRIHADFVGAWTAESDRAGFVSFVKDKQLERRIRIHGAVHDRRRIREFLREADVLVLPTYYPNEAQPLAVVEALNAAVPVIATPHRSLPEMIDENESGLFVSPKSPDEIASALRRLRGRTTWLRLSEGARERFENRFSADAVLDRWLDLVM